MKRVKIGGLVFWLSLSIFGMLLPQEVLAQKDMEQISAEMLREIRTGKTTLYEAYATPEVLKAAPSSQIVLIWKQLEAQLGQASEGVLETVSDRVGDNRRFVQALSFGSTTLGFLTVFNPKDELVGIAFQPYQLKKVVDQQAERAPYGQSDDYEEQSIQIVSGTYRLPGTLTRPKGIHPIALVIFLVGSGPNDRHSTVGPNRPHQDMADGLARYGIASLRFDKRTFAAASQIQAEGLAITIDNEVVDDALAAISFAKSLADINPNRVFLLGHSLGGMLAPRVASAAELAGIIIMAGNARPLEALVREQYEKLFAGNPGKEAAIQALDGQIANLAKLNLDVELADKDLPLGLPASYWRSLKAYDQVLTAQQLKIPILILQGEADYQVSMDDFGIWQKALPKASSISYPGLDHLMRPANGKIGIDAYSGKEFVSEQVVKDIAAWIKAKK